MYLWPSDTIADIHMEDAAKEEQEWREELLCVIQSSEAEVRRCRDAEAVLMQRFESLAARYCQTRLAELCAAKDAAEDEINATNDRLDALYGLIERSKRAIETGARDTHEGDDALLTSLALATRSAPDTV